MYEELILYEYFLVEFAAGEKFNQDDICHIFLGLNFLPCLKIGQKDYLLKCPFQKGQAYWINGNYPSHNLDRIPVLFFQKGGETHRVVKDIMVVGANQKKLRG